MAGRPRKYAWDDWFEAARGRHGTHVDLSSFDVSVRSFQIQARTAADASNTPLVTQTCRIHPFCMRLWTRSRVRRDWSKVLDGKENVVLYSEMKCTPESYRRMLRAAASKKGLKLNILERPEIGAIKVQAIKGPP